MKAHEWMALKHGDKVKHNNGDVETVYEFAGEKYLEGEKSLFPLSEFDPDDFEKVER